MDIEELYQRMDELYPEEEKKEEVILHPKDTAYNVNEDLDEEAEADSEEEGNIMAILT
jgi:hypothetical protein